MRSGAWRNQVFRVHAGRRARFGFKAFAKVPHHCACGAIRRRRGCNACAENFVENAPRKVRSIVNAGGLVRGSGCFALGRRLKIRGGAPGWTGPRTATRTDAPIRRQPENLQAHSSVQTPSDREPDAPGTDALRMCRPAGCPREEDAGRGVRDGLGRSIQADDADRGFQCVSEQAEDYALHLGGQPVYTEIPEQS